MRALSLTLATAALSLFAFVELVGAWPVAWWLYAAVTALYAVGLVRVTAWRHQAPQLCALAALTVAAATLHLVDWTTRKPFLRDLARIRAGMTEAEVLVIMAPYREGTGWHVPDAGSPPGSPPTELELRDSLVFRHSDDAAFNSDWGIVSLRNGRVAAVEFSAD